jgi:site-specific recombinase XerD
MSEPERWEVATIGAEGFVTGVLRPSLEDARPSAGERPEGLLAGLDAAQSRYEDAALAPASRRAYASSLKQFAAWCDEVGLTAYPADGDTVARYATLRARDGLQVSSLDRALAAIRYLHLFGPDPEVADPTMSPRVVRTMRGIRREHGVPATRKRALSARDVVTMIEPLDLDTNAGLRDRAVLMFGYAAGMRRGELAALDRTDLQDDPDGLRALLRDAKGDRERRGQLIGVAFGPAAGVCPVRALRAWLAASSHLTGPVFRPVDRHDNIGDRGLSGQAIADILKRRADAAGLDPATVAGHSLRSGHATGAARSGVALSRIQQQLRHRRIDTTAGYVRTANIVRDSSSRHVWDDLVDGAEPGGEP